MSALAKVESYIVKDKCWISTWDCGPCNGLEACHKNKCQLFPAPEQEVTASWGLIIKLIALEKRWSGLVYNGIFSEAYLQLTPELRWWKEKTRTWRAPLNNTCMQGHIHDSFNQNNTMHILKDLLILYTMRFLFHVDLDFVSRNPNVLFPIYPPFSSLQHLVSNNVRHSWEEQQANHA